MLGMLNVPGSGRPLEWMPEGGKHFPTTGYFDENSWRAATLLIREVCMLSMIEEFTNRPDWWLQVRDGTVTELWKMEALVMDWKAVIKYGDFTPEMADALMKVPVYCRAQGQGRLIRANGIVPVMDYSACALKSDSLISDNLRTALKNAVAPLENIPDHLKDWQPGSDDNVLDLIDPSLWPLCYGRSLVLPDRRINREDCLRHCGKGDTFPMIPEDTPWDEARSRDFQWLPCDVAIDETTGKIKIESYINNLHPTDHADLYDVIEKVIEKSLAPWDIIYRWPREFDFQRLKINEVGDECLEPDVCTAGFDDSAPSSSLDGDDQGGNDRKSRYKRYTAWFESTHPVLQPDCADFDELYKFTPLDVKTETGFFNSAQRIQVMVKLTNIHLTPEKPEYEGGSWHVQGQLNEHICATALYYYDSDNITNTHLSFGTRPSRENLSETLEYAPYDFDSINRTFAIDAEGNADFQQIGGVLTRTGRALFFPNVYQTRTQSFRLDDASRPGHCKALALFLVDPAITIASTANVPPQQRHWWAKGSGMTGMLPPELMDGVLEGIDFPTGLDEAKSIRLKLMKERSRVKWGPNTESDGWNFGEEDD